MSGCGSDEPANKASLVDAGGVGERDAESPSSVRDAAAEGGDVGDADTQGTAEDAGADGGEKADDERPEDAEDAGVDGGRTRKVTLTRKDPDLTREAFEEACNQAGGVLEVHPHCGGANSCKGFSYDTTIAVYSEHTCQGLNTCTGYSCVVPDATT
jgi:hypothetical protein